MPRFRVGSSSILITFAALLGSLLSIFAIAVRFVPVLDEIKYLKDSIDLYIQYVRTPALRVFGLATPDATAGIWTFAADALLFWVAFFVVINVFTYRHEGGLLPSHIYSNHCQYRARGIFPAIACVAPKLLLAFALAPIVCPIYALTKAAAPKDRLYSAVYMTIRPREVLGYLIVLFGSVAIILLIAQQALLLTR